MNDGAPDAPDTSASAQVTDHVFQPAGEWWSVCKICRLGRAAHASVENSTEVTDDDPSPLPVAEVDKSVMEEHVVVTDRFRCGVPGPAPGLSCELDHGHEGLHSGYPPQVKRMDESRIMWGEPVAAEQDDPIGGGRLQELLTTEPDPSHPAAGAMRIADLPPREALVRAGLSGEEADDFLQHEMAAVGSVDHVADIAHAWGAGTRGKDLVEGTRQEQHGDPVPNMERIARGWSIILEAEVRPQHVPLMMVWFKVVRESRNHLDDNLDDIEGYTEIMRQVVGELGS